MNPDLLQGFYLGEFLVDPGKGQVIGRTDSAHLPPKAMDVLLCLTSNAGQLVTRKTLLNTVWGEGKGSPAALTRAVSDIRHALHDHHDNPRYVATLPTRGYRLLVAPRPTPERKPAEIPGAHNTATTSQSGLFESLKQRGVFETGVAYLVFGWLLIQIVDIIFSQLHLPAWAGTFVTLLVIAGFPIAVLLSWFLEFRHGRAVLHELSPDDALKHRFSRTYKAVIGALLIAAVFVYFYDRNVGLPEEQAPAVVNVEPASYLPPIQDNSIAILPFFNLDGSEETQIFANGLVEDVINGLARVPGLLVASRGDSFSMNPNSASARVRERLRVAQYVEGSVQIVDDTLRVVVQLIDSATGFHALSRSFDRPLADFFQMRDEIMALTVASVRVALPHETRITWNEAGAGANLDVYRLYRRGVDASRQPSSVESIIKSLDWFDAALKIDPEYAAAYAGKCVVSVKAYPVTDDPAYIEAAEVSCAKALNLNPNLDVAYAALGRLYLATGRYNEAEAAYLQALRIEPASTHSLMGLGEVYRLQQRPDEAEASVRRAAGLQPGDWAAYQALGSFLFHSGRFFEAAEQYSKVVALDHSNVNGYANLGSAYLLAGEFSAAESAFQRAIDLEAGAFAYGNFGMVLYYQNRFDEAVVALRFAVEREPQDYLTRANLGDALWAAGKRPDAVSEFEIARRLALGALEVNPNDALTLMDLAWVYTMLGVHDPVQGLIERATALVPGDPYVHYIEGLILNNRGDTTAALSAFEVALKLGYSAQLLAADPNLAALRQDSRFAPLLTRSN